jgi:hypothetical protein
MKHNETVFAVYGLPPAYANGGWEGIDVSQDEIDRYKTAFSSPISSTVFVQGSCAPIIQQLLEQGSKVRGIDLSKRQNAAFEDHNNPDADVILIWNVNKYSGRPEVSINLLNNLINYYRTKSALVIVQSPESSIFMRDNYGFQTPNKIKLLPKAEVKWLS